MTMPAARIERRVRYVFKDSYRGGKPFTHTDDGWFDATPEGAAAYPWLMENCIAWIEERIVYDPEPWEPVSLR